MGTRNRLILAALVLGGLAAFAPPAGADVVAVVHGRVETSAPAGTIEDGTVLITDGRISAVGVDVRVPASARVIDARGKVVTAGLIAASTDLTVSDVEGVRATVDDRAGTFLGAANDLQYAVNPAASAIAEARRTGITRAIVTPAPARGGDGEDEDAIAHSTAGDKSGAPPRLFGGQAAAVRLGATETEPVFLAHAAVTLDLGEAGAAAAGSRGTALVLAHEALDDARRYARHRATFETQDLPSHASRADLEALQGVIGRSAPLLVRAHRAADLREVLRFAARENIRVIIEGAEEGWIVAADLARAGVPVIIDSEADLPESFEEIGARLDNATRLQAAGVSVSIVGSRTFGTLRQARLNAGTAVAYGLPYAAALESITRNPALAYGVADRVGSLEPGRDGDVVVWNGDPLEVSSYPLVVLIRGVEQPTSSRTLDLRDRYLPQDTAAH